MWIAGFALFILGIIFIILYVYIRRKHTRCSAQTQGILREIRKNRSEEPPRDEYFYSYSVNGIDYQLKTFDRSPQTNVVGDHCTIWYNPAKPKDALAHHYDSLKIFKIFLISGIAMVPLGIILFMAGLAQ